MDKKKITPIALSYNYVSKKKKKLNRQTKHGLYQPQHDINLM